MKYFEAMGQVGNRFPRYEDSIVADVSTLRTGELSEAGAEHPRRRIDQFLAMKHRSTTSRPADAIPRH